jgi:hypothetical protein
MKWNRQRQELNERERKDRGLQRVATRQKIQTTEKSGIHLSPSNLPSADLNFDQKWASVPTKTEKGGQSNNKRKSQSQPQDTNPTKRVLQTGMHFPLMTWVEKIEATKETSINKHSLEVSDLLVWWSCLRLSVTVCQRNQR